MIAKGHCKVRYGDGYDDEEVELEEFYDYSSRYSLFLFAFSTSSLLPLRLANYYFTLYTFVSLGS